jgi:hypothetical protein
MAAAVGVEKKGKALPLPPAFSKLAALSASDMAYARKVEIRVMAASGFDDVESAMQLTLETEFQRRFHWHRWLRLATAPDGQVTQLTRRLAVYAIQCIVDRMAFR